MSDMVAMAVINPCIDQFAAQFFLEVITGLAKLDLLETSADANIYKAQAQGKIYNSCSRFTV